MRTGQYFWGAVVVGSPFPPRSLVFLRNNADCMPLEAGHNADELNVRYSSLRPVALASDLPLRN